MFVTEYRGLSVSEQQRLRRALREASAEYKIYKMTLARRAATEAGLEGLLDMLEGPTGLAFVSDDPVMAAKAMRDIADEVEAFALKADCSRAESSTLLRSGIWQMSSHAMCRYRRWPAC